MAVVSGGQHRHPRGTKLSPYSHRRLVSMLCRDHGYEVARVECPYPPVRNGRGDIDPGYTVLRKVWRECGETVLEHELRVPGARRAHRCLSQIEMAAVMNTVRLVEQQALPAVRAARKAHNPL